MSPTGAIRPGRPVAVGLLLSLIPLTGCGIGSAARQAFYEIRGAETEIKMISDFSPQKLEPYRAILTRPATTTVGPRLCPPRLLDYYNEYLARLPEQLREQYPGGKPALELCCEIIYFQPKGLFSGALCLARVRMFDADDRHLVADAMVLTESKSFRDSSRRDLAESSVKGLRKLLRDRRLPEKSILDLD